MSVPHEITDLIERFDRNAEDYRSGRYNETQLRRDFIDPFFEALGWDINNRQGLSERFRHVIHEDAIKIGGHTKAPDYGFYVGETRMFFVEAKKPSVNIKHDVAAAFQLRRYGWSAKLPLSILTSFDEFAVYDCRSLKPVNTDKASTARLMYFGYQEYAERWDEIASIFSRDAVQKGAFDKYAAQTKGRRGTAEVDDAFLEEIESWRKALASNIYLRNPHLTTRELNFAVGIIIDRIIFLRICEDRGIEPDEQLKQLINSKNIYQQLLVIFYRADQKYNSGLFHFDQEKGRAESPDKLTPSLSIDDKVLKEIFKNVYLPLSPYEFSVLPADILGQVYEQFLGKVIHLTAHRAVVEDKPEVRKAGGVYYTPSYIVDYIVKHTVGKLCEGKTAKQVDKLRILDPACGSGSFLIAAYQYLLDWYLDWYVKDSAEKHHKQLAQGARGEWRLATAEKRRILRQNIYGVDIDSQAVEVTKLSLLLKVLEGETEQSLARQMRLLHERVLPDLGSNIKCGNSLIARDFYDDPEMHKLSDEEQDRINVFNWEKEFPEIIKEGGFDAVIGNPPYGALITPAEANYLRAKFETSNKDLDTYTLFIEQAIRICRNLGRVSMIVPTGFYSGAKFSSLRRFLSRTTDPEVFVNLPYDIFKAWVDTTIFVVIKRSAPTVWPRQVKCKVQLRTFPKRHHIVSSEEFETDLRSAEFTDWFANSNDEFLTYADSATTSVISKIQNGSEPLQEFADVQRGVTPFNLTNSITHSTSHLAFNGTVRRYKLERGPICYIRFDETLAEPKPERYFKGPRLLLRELISRQFQLQAVKVSEDFVTNKSMQSILQLPDTLDLNYLLGFINSRLMSWYFLHRSNIAQRDDFPKIVLKETRTLPIRPIDFSDSADKARHDRMVERMLDLHKQLAKARTDQERRMIDRRIDTTDAQIDALVYELYGLTEDEIKIVEASTQ